MTTTTDPRKDLYAFAMQGKEHSPAISDRASEKIDAYRGAVIREAAQHLYTALFPAVYDDLGQKAAEGVNRSVSELRRMADEGSRLDAFRASVLRDFLWRLEQSSGDQVAAKLVEENPEWAELLSATEVSGG